MPRFPIILSAVLAFGALLSSGPVAAKNDGHCPPGLAKKNPPCVPPGLAKKAHGGDDEDHHWRPGDRVDGDYVLIPRAEWERLLLRDFDDDSTYLQVDDQILRVVRDTLVVIEAIGIVSDLLN